LGRQRLQPVQVVEYRMCGHFHHKSNDGHIFYLGTPYEITWSDYGNEKGFHIFDFDKRDFEFIRIG
jgi:DNA repair exonuclease SbcCD nuclease subunit